MKWAANTAVICSFLGLLGGCDSRNQKKKTDDKNKIKVGVQSDLMSFDPFSFQALGESNITDLLYDRFIYFEDSSLKSDFGIDVRIEGSSLIIKKLEPKLAKKIKDIFEKSRQSILWKDLFRPFDFEIDDDRLKIYKITYKDQMNFISNLKSLAPLLIVDGDVRGAYKIKNVQKGIKLNLEKNIDWVGSEPRLKKITLKKIKTVSDGLKQVSQKEIDVFLPFHPSKKGDLEPYQDLDFVKSPDRFQKLRLYSKYGKPSALKSLFCKNKEEISKVLEKSWALKSKTCDKKDEPVLPEDLKIIMSSDYGQKILDLLAQAYKKESGKNLEYEVLDSLKLSERLRSGNFDHYLSLDVEFKDMPVLFDSFHSKGRYNSLKINDSELDALLVRAGKARTLKTFEKFEDLSRARLKEVAPYVFEYSRPHTDFVVLKNNKIKILKSSKKLMNFQK